MSDDSAPAEAKSSSLSSVDGKSEDSPVLGGVTGGSADALADIEAKTWIGKQIEAEVARLREQGARCIAVPVNNMGIYREGPTVINRVECDTTFDFSKVNMILTSAETACPVKPGYAYVNVVLFTEKPVPLLLPYLYDKAHQEDNDLSEWAFVNKIGARVRHKMDNAEVLSS